MLQNYVPISFFARASKLLPDFHDLRQSRPLSKRDASGTCGEFNLDFGPVSAASGFESVLVGVSLTRAASAKLARHSLFASDLNPTK
jgi:hypothetical protein